MSDETTRRLHDISALDCVVLVALSEEADVINPLLLKGFAVARWVEGNAVKSIDKGFWMGLKDNIFRAPY